MNHPRVRQSKTTLGSQSCESPTVVAQSCQCACQCCSSSTSFCPAHGSPWTSHHDLLSTSSIDKSVLPPARNQPQQTMFEDSLNSMTQLFVDRMQKALTSPNLPLVKTAGRSKVIVFTLPSFLNQLSIRLAFRDVRQHLKFWARRVDR